MSEVETTSVKFSWWVKPYLFVSAYAAMLRGREPDVDRIWARVEESVMVKK